MLDIWWPCSDLVFVQMFVRLFFFLLRTGTIFPRQHHDCENWHPVPLCVYPNLKSSPINKQSIGMGETIKTFPTSTRHQAPPFFLPAIAIGVCYFGCLVEFLLRKSKCWFFRWSGKENKRRWDFLGWNNSKKFCVERRCCDLTCFDLLFVWNDAKHHWHIGSTNSDFETLGKVLPNVDSSVLLPVYRLSVSSCAKNWSIRVENQSRSLRWPRFPTSSRHGVSISTATLRRNRSWRDL